MLPAPLRLRRGDDIAEVVRRGRRAASATVVAHVRRTDDDAPARAGLIVGKVVGGSVVRHRVSRRLRHLVAPHLSELPAGTRVVLRALAPAGQATSAELGRDLATTLAPR